MQSVEWYIQGEQVGSSSGQKNSAELETLADYNAPATKKVLSCSTLWQLCQRYSVIDQGDDFDVRNFGSSKTKSIPNSFGSTGILSVFAPMFPPASTFPRALLRSTNDHKMDTGYACFEH